MGAMKVVDRFDEVEASIKEARHHPGPLNARKMLFDLECLAVSERGHRHNLSLSDMRIEEDGKLIASLRAQIKCAAKDRAEIEDRLDIAVKARAKVDELAKENWNLRAEINNLSKSSAPGLEWLIWDKPTREWWRGRGLGITYTRSNAGRYTWEAANKFRNLDSNLILVHVSAPDPGA